MIGEKKMKKAIASIVIVGTLFSSALLIPVRAELWIYLANPYVDNYVDVDGDGYYRSVDFNWNADVDQSVYVDVYVEFEGRDSSGVWQYLGNYGIYTIYNMEVDYKKFTVTVPHWGVWDIKLELYRWDSPPELVDDWVAYDIPMEPPSEDEERKLTVSSAHDSPVPSNGDHYYNHGTSVTCSVTSPVIEGDTVWACTGWTGTGSVPASGSDTSVTFPITEDSTITWNWQDTPIQINILTPIQNNLAGQSFFDLMEDSIISQGIIADATIEIEVTPSDMIQSVDIKLSGNIIFLGKDTFHATKTGSGTFVSNIVLQNALVIVNFIFTFVGANLVYEGGLLGDVVPYELPDPIAEITEIIATDVYGGVHSKSFNTPLPTAGPLLSALIPTPSSSAMAFCPIDILVVDSQGRRVGALYENGQFVEIISEIPGAYYARNNVSDGAKYIYLPFSNELYELQVFGNSTGSFNLTAYTIMDQDFNGNFSIVEDEIGEGEQMCYLLAISSDGAVTLTAPTPVGGIYIPVNKLSLLAPYIALTILLAGAAVTVVYVDKRKRDNRSTREQTI